MGLFSAKSIRRSIADFFTIPLTPRRVSGCLVDKRYRDRNAIFGTQVSRDVTFSRCVFDQVDLTRADCNFFPSGNLDFSSAAERDHKLTSGTGMPLVCTTWRTTAELHAGRLDHLRRVAVQFHLDVFGVTQTVRTRVDARHHDRFPRLGGDDIRLGVCQPSQTKRTGNANEYE